MNAPSPEQQAVLNCDSRVRIVQAVPGSGKTWLVSELIRKELTTGKAIIGGIAALSFTRVGGEEIRRAVGHDLSHPHFVGTIDAFLFRYVVRPFLRKVFPQIQKDPKLIPADWSPEYWSNGRGIDWQVRLSFTKKGQPGINLFKACYVASEKQGEPVLAHSLFPSGFQKLSVSDSSLIHDAKKKIWVNQGFMTHSDAAFLANKILEDTKCGLMIREDIVRRFPLLIIDELQDTGWYLGECILKILETPSSRSVLVGDPDQAIYEFNGARPDLFERFKGSSGSKLHFLGRSRRCPESVCIAAKNLASMDRELNHDPSKNGRAFLVSYQNLEAEIPLIRQFYSDRLETKNVKVIARHTKTAEKILGILKRDTPSLGSVPLNHMHRATNYFRLGKVNKALASSKAVLEKIIFGYEGVSNDELVQKEIGAGIWKQICVEILLESCVEIENETLEGWAKRILEMVRGKLTTIVPSENTKIRSLATNVKRLSRSVYLASIPNSSSNLKIVPVQTVHSVKGETHETTIFVCPRAGKGTNCISKSWWETDPEELEERRIAFVAFTRTCGDLIVCVHEKSLENLKTNRPDFVRSFSCMKTSEFISLKQQELTSASSHG